MENFKLYNGFEIPKIGFGTYKNVDSSVVENAIKSGYTLLDTASYYNTENLIKEAIQNLKIDRKDLIITSKLWKNEMGYENTKKAFYNSLKKLGTEYLDIYLIHWPKPDYTYNEWKKLDIETWKALEELYKEGKVKAIGVSNFLSHHLENLIQNCEIKPMINQIEYHIGYTQQYTVDYCKENNICLQAWSPISRQRIFNEELIIELAKKYNVSLSQLCLRFIVQNGICPIPKSSNIDRMKENKDIFSFVIEKEDMQKLNSLPQFGWSGEHPDRKRIYFN